MMKSELINYSKIANEITSRRRANVIESDIHFDEQNQILALALICKRYFKHINFKESTYFQIELLHTKSFFEFKSQSKFRLEDEKQAKKILKSIQRIEKLEVVDIILDRIIEDPPLLFNIIDLQIEANLRFNFNSEETLKIVQSLYNKKFITNPLTKSKYIHEEMWSNIPTLVRILQERDEYKKVTNYVKWGTFNKKIVNNQKALNHQGILITDKIPSALTVKEKVIYEMIMFRFLEAISKPCIKEISTIELEVSQHQFTTQYCKIIDSGWCSIKGNFSDDLEIIQDFPIIRNGDELKINQSFISEKKMKPQELYSEANLLLVIENTLNKISIFSTSFIEKLIEKNCIIRNNRLLIPTEKGLSIVELMNHKPLNNKEIITHIDQDICLETSSITTKLYCPKCKDKELMINVVKAECPEKTCNWVQFRNVCGVQLSISEIENLIYKGETSFIEGFQVKSGKKFNAKIELNENAESSFVIQKRK